MDALRLQPSLAGRWAQLTAWTEVLKCSRCLPVALSAGFGGIFFRPVVDPTLVAAMIGVLLLAFGCAGLNSAQEAKVDGLFSRTRHRPLVTGQLNRIHVLLLSFAILAAGLVLLFAGHSTRWLPPLLGLGACLLYNGIYTPLKPITVLALFPGGLAGGLPPLIGWTSSGGQLDDPRSWLLLSLFFLWQIPHYCLIVLHHRQDYRTVPIPSLIRLFSETSLKRITILWIVAFMVVMLIIASSFHFLQPVSRWILASTAIMLAGLIGRLLCGDRQRFPYRRMLQLFNGTFFTVMTVVSIWQVMTHLADVHI